MIHVVSVVVVGAVRPDGYIRAGNSVEDVDDDVRLEVAGSYDLFWKWGGDFLQRVELTG